MFTAPAFCCGSTGRVIEFAGVAVIPRRFMVREGSLMHIRFNVCAVALFAVTCFCSSIYAQPCNFTIARLKYNGGGDWYSNPSSLPNLVAALKERTSVKVCDTIATVTLDDDNLFRHPFIYMTGHGNVLLTAKQRIILRKYLIGGGFLWADDNYGLDQSFRREMMALFPDLPLQRLPDTHALFSSFYKLPALPKIHEHDGKPAEARGIYFEKRLIVLYTFSSDIGDGMEDLAVHNDGAALHEVALKMGINVVLYFLNP